MNTIKNKTMLCLLACVMSATAFAQVPGGALEYMLQKPRVSKYYTDKKPFDHLFIDAGAGVSAVGPARPKLDGFVELNIGDWITPEHGVRLNANLGRYKRDDVKAKYYGFGLDYLLNLTALSQYGPHYNQRRFELYGIAGVDYISSRYAGNDEHGLGVHVGLRGQMALSPFTYFYVEPRVGVMDDDVSQVKAWHGYRPVATLSAGLGYRLPETRRHADGEHGDGGWSDGLFLGVMGGPTVMFNSAPSTWIDNGGFRLAGSIGKWFGNTNGVRLTVNGSYFKQQSHNKVKAIGVQADYMLNLHNAFGGYNPDRWFWFNAVAGLSYNFSSVRPDIDNHTMGIGAGLQANVRLSRDLDFVIEPRVDLYNERYAPHRTSIGNHDVMGSVLAGLVYTHHGRKAQRGEDDTFTTNGWYDHTFVEAGIGANIPLLSSAVEHPGSYMRPSLYLAVGKWFSPVHGMRLWGQMAQTQYSVYDKYRYKHLEIGADYLFNFTNAVYGYHADRKFDVTGALGANFARREECKRLHFGLDASLRGTWHPSRLMGIFIEPRLQGYGDKFLPVSFRSTNLDFVASIHAGVQFNLDAQGRSQGNGQADEEGKRSSIMLAGGLTNHLNTLDEGRMYSPVARLSYTRWYSPVAAWRFNGQVYVQRVVDGKRMGQVSLGADWMTDLTAQTYGYDPARLLSVSVFAGANAGVDFGGGKAHFAPDVHAGGQLSLRLSDAVHFNVEPQLAYQMSSRWNSQRERVMPQVLLGIEYSMKRHKGTTAATDAPARPNVVMAGIGAGTYSSAYRESLSHTEKLTFNVDLGYGRWFNRSNGAYVRLSNMTAQRRGDHNQNITSLQAGYMMDVKSAVTGESADGDTFRFTALLGASMNMSSRQGQKKHYAPGLQAALQAGVLVTPQLEIFVEPSAGIMGKTIEHHHAPYAVEGAAKISIGTKIHF